MAGSRPARIEITADSRSLTAGLRRASAQVAGFAATTSRTVGRYSGASAVVMGRVALAGGKAVAGSAVKAARTVTLGAAAIGTAALLSAASNVREFEEGLTRLGISAGKTPAQMSVFRDQIRAASRETGIASNEILGGAKAYVELTGDIDGAMKQARLFARVTQASGSQMADVASTAAALQDSLKIDPSQMEAAFSALMVQGKAGAVELKDMAGEMASLAPTMTGFAGGTGLQGLRELGAALQVTRKGFGSASEAATGMVSLTTSLKKHADKFQGAGVKLFTTDRNGVKTFRNFRDIVREIGASKLAKDPTKLAKAFGSVEALRAFTELNRNAALYDELIEKGNDVGGVQRDLTAYLESAPGRISLTWNKFKEAVASTFTPERIEKFAAALERSFVVMGDIVDKMIIAKQIIDGDDSNLLSPEALGRWDGVKAQLGLDAPGDEPPPAFQMPDLEHFKTRTPGTTTDLPVVSEWEGIGRDLIGSSRDYNLGSLLRYEQAQRTERTNPYRQAMMGDGRGLFFGTMAAAATEQKRVTQAEATMIANAIARALVGLPPPEITIGSDALAHTVKNAPSRRRRPGG